MRVGINLVPLWPGKIGGMETYVRNLLEHIATLDKTNEYYLFTAVWNDNTLEFASPNFKRILAEENLPEFSPQATVQKSNIMSRAIKKIRDLQHLRTILHKRKFKSGKLNFYVKELHIDVWFCPLISLEPRNIDIPSVITIPDVQQEYYPEFFTEQELHNRSTNWKQSCHLATRVLTISEFSKQSICEKYQLSTEKVDVTLLSVGDEFLLADSGDDNRVAEKYSLPKKYAFYPANTWPHKNHQLLITGYALFKKRVKSDLKLVLSGLSDEREHLQSLIVGYGLVDDVIFLGHIERNEMPSVYRNAVFMIFPSLFEGFGIPLLEAMVSDCPIATSNTTSMPEIAGDAAYYFDPGAHDEIAAAIEKMAVDSELRSTLKQAGQARFKKFSWDKTAEHTLHTFETLYK